MPIRARTSNNGVHVHGNPDSRARQRFRMSPAALRLHDGRTTQRRARKVASEEGALRGDIVRFASRFGRYGYRRASRTCSASRAGG